MINMLFLERHERLELSRLRKEEKHLIKGLGAYEIIVRLFDARREQ